MAEKYTLKLKATSKPHLYIDQIKQYLIEDKTLHPMMKKTLLLMKKTRMPYIILATLKEIILVPEKELHLERALQPTLGGFVRIDWSEETKANFKKDIIKAREKMFELYLKLGYEISKFEEVSVNDIDKLLAITDKQK